MIVEDGTIVPGSNSYASTAYADQYHAGKGNVAWAAIPSETDVPAPAAGVMTKEALLIRATSYMVQFYRLKWAGYRVSPTQTLDWPRIGVILKDTASYFVDLRLSYTVPSNIVPDQVQQACAELALKAYQQPNYDLAPDLDQRTITEKVGPIAVTYDRFSPQYRRYRSVDLLLSALQDSSNGMTTQIRRG